MVARCPLRRIPRTPHGPRFVTPSILTASQPCHITRNTRPGSNARTLQSRHRLRNSSCSHGAPEETDHTLVRREGYPAGSTTLRPLPYLLEKDSSWLLNFTFVLLTESEQETRVFAPLTEIAVPPPHRQRTRPRERRHPKMQLPGGNFSGHPECTTDGHFLRSPLKNPLR
jgi:hypothetical protein